MRLRPACVLSHLSPRSLALAPLQSGNRWVNGPQTRRRVFMYRRCTYRRHANGPGRKSPMHTESRGARSSLSTRMHSPPSPLSLYRGETRRDYLTLYSAKRLPHLEFLISTQLRPSRSKFSSTLLPSYKLLQALGCELLARKIARFQVGFTSYFYVYN